MLPDINGKEVCQRASVDPSLMTFGSSASPGWVEEDKVSELAPLVPDDFTHSHSEVERLVERMCQLLDMESVSN